MTQLRAPGTEPDGHLPTSPLGPARAGDSKILATWFTENPASQDGNVAGNLDLSHLISSVATSPEVRQREAVDSARRDSNRTVARLPLRGLCSFL